jgi:hypothetical protein
MLLGQHPVNVDDGTITRCLSAESRLVRADWVSAALLDQTRLPPTIPAQSCYVRADSWWRSRIGTVVAALSLRKPWVSDRPPYVIGGV